MQELKSTYEKREMVDEDYNHTKGLIERKIEGVWFKFDSVTFAARTNYAYNDNDTSVKTNVNRFSMDKYELTELNYYKVMGGTRPATDKEIMAHEFYTPYSAVNFIIELNKAFRPKYYSASSESTKITDTTNSAYFGTSGRTLISSTISSTNILKCNRSVKGFRMPDPVEWCVAAKNGSNVFPYGSTSLTNLAWTADTDGFVVHKVGQKSKNANGLYDMFGNVDELVHMYNLNEQGTDTVTGGSSTCVRIIGGCCSEYASTIPTSTKHGMGAYYAFGKYSSGHNYGLRLVMDGN